MARADCGVPATRKNWVPLLWLVYLFWLPVDPILSHAPEWQYIAAGVSTVVFLLLYVYSFFKLDQLHPARVPIIVAIYAIGTWLMTFNIGASGFFMYGSGMIGYSLSPRRAWPFLLLYSASIPLISGLLLHDKTFVWAMAFVFSSVLGVANIRAAEEARMNAKLQVAHDQVERLAKVAERERIARDLHDVLGHTLSLIVLKSELAAKLAERDATRAAIEIRDVESIARGALEELRDAVTGYRSAGVAAEVDHARQVLESAGVTFDARTESVRLSPLHESVLALAIREAVTNVVRHADATTVRIRLAASQGTCHFEIADDGCGADVTIEGNGLTGMRERIEALGGTMLRDGRNGTRLSLTLPMEARVR